MPIPPFNTYLGTEVVRKDAGGSEVVLDLAPHHLNRRGVAHGGVITSLLDSALGAAVIASMPREWWCATTSLSTQFLDGVGRGRLRATGRVLRRGRSVAFAAGEVRDDRDRVIATASGTWQLWPHRPGRVRPADEAFVTLRESGERIQVGKILAVGRNYAEHRVEMGQPPEGMPVLFFKPPTAIVHDGARVPLPSGVGDVHHEVELVVVIGSPGRAIAPDRAHEHVLGYAVGLDLTLRDLQSEAKQRGEPWCLAKGFDGSAPVSSVAPRDEVGDGSALEIRLDVNGETRQQANTSQMLWGVADLITHASRWITLRRGDLIFSGTPAGVGPLRPGDRVEATLEKVGTLSLVVSAEQ